MQATTGQSVESLVAAALRGELTDAQARRLAQHGPEIVTLALLAASERIAEQNARLAALQTQTATPRSSPSTPSAMVPVYTKPTTTRRRKKPGARSGHQGTRRAKPTRIDERREHRLERCPDCGGPLNKCRRSRTRIIEDIPEEITPVVTEHTLHRDFCPKW